MAMITSECNSTRTFLCPEDKRHSSAFMAKSSVLPFPAVSPHVWGCLICLFAAYLLSCLLSRAQAVRGRGLSDVDKEAHEQRNGMDHHGQGQCPGSVWASAEKK